MPYACANHHVTCTHQKAAPTSNSAQHSQHHGLPFPRRRLLKHLAMACHISTHEGTSHPLLKSPIFMPKNLTHAVKQIRALLPYWWCMNRPEKIGVCQLPCTSACSPPICVPCKIYPESSFISPHIDDNLTLIPARYKLGSAMRIEDHITRALQPF